MSKSDCAHAERLADGSTCRPSTIEGCLEYRGSTAPFAPVMFRADGSPLVNRHLLEYCNQFSEVMQRSPLSATSRVAILVENGLETAIATVAVMAKAVAVPLSPQITASELIAVLRTTKADALLIDGVTSSSTLRALQEYEIPLIYLHPESTQAETIFTAMSQGAEGRGPGSIVRAPTDLCMILQTSGTTATPKLVPFSEERILGIATAYARAFLLGDDDCCLNPMSLQHTHGIFALFAALVSGGSIFCTANAYPATIIQHLQELPITWLTAVPTVLQALVNAPALPSSLPRPLRFIRSSAAHLASATVLKLEDRFATAVYETYGLTEISFAAISYSDNRRSGSIGHPAEHIEIQILDRDRKPCIRGSLGEIALRSAYITPEYLDNPAATAAAFHDGWFLTGDEGYIDNDGYIYLTGRLKEIINRAGENISPNEIDEVLMGHPLVAQAVSFGVAHPQMGERVVSAVVLHQQAELTEGEVKQFASSSLASFKIPSQVIFVENIPCGKTGKIQRRFLPEHFRQKIESTASSTLELPTTFYEAQVTQTFSTALQIHQISLHDDFFHLGGNSLQAASICAELSEHFKMTITPALLLQYSTVHGLADYIGLLENGAGIAQQSKRPTNSLLVLNADLPGTPLIFFHQDFDYGGIYMRRFAQGLRRPVVVIDPVLPAEVLAKRTIEIFAEYYVSLIKLHYPHGPYVLGGFCAGGTVAYEIARRLSGQGDQVQSLILVNSVAKNHRFGWLDYLTTLTCGKNTQRKTAWFLRFRRALTGSHSINQIQWSAPARALWQYVRHKLGKVSPPRENSSSAAVLREQEWMGYHIANVVYCPERLSVPTVLFVCDEAPQDQQYGWDRYVRTLRKEYFPGRQDDLISTHAEQVVRAIESVLSEEPLTFIG